MGPNATARALAVGAFGMIEAASVQWVSGQTFGLAFAKLSNTEQERLAQVVKDLMDEGSGAG